MDLTLRSNLLKGAAIYVPSASVFHVGRFMINCRLGETAFINYIADDDPVTGEKKCCPRLGERFTVDPIFKTEGGCCMPPLVWAYDSVAKAGKCCGLGLIFKGGECIPPVTPPPKCAKCSKDYVCACDGDLGLQYGHCYTMTDVNGLQLNRAVDGTYQSGGDIGNLIFRVSSPSPCSAF